MGTEKGIDCSALFFAHVLENGSPETDTPYRVRTECAPYH
jgi:hypothetical protein